MITVTKVALGATALAAAGMVAVAKQPAPEPQLVQVFKSDRVSFGEAWAPECAAVLAKGETCIFTASYKGVTSKVRFVTVEQRRDDENTSMLLRVPATESSIH